MNSKQALEQIIFDAKMEKPIFSMYYQEFLKPIEKDLEVLEIIKRKLIIATNFVSFITYDNEEEYKKIMEWIINEINKNKSVDSES